MARPITGAMAAIRWRYFEAARLEQYRVVHEDDRWSLRARVISHNAYNLAQSDLMLIAPHQAGAWYWPILEWTISGQTLTARLGPPIDRQEDYGRSLRTA